MPDRRLRSASTRPVVVIGGGTLGASIVQAIHDAPDLSLHCLISRSCSDKSCVLASGLGYPTSSEVAEAILPPGKGGVVIDARPRAAAEGDMGAFLSSGLSVVTMTPGYRIIPTIAANTHGMKLDSGHISLGSSMAQMAVPFVRRIAEVGSVTYAEAVFTIASSTLGVGARAEMADLTALAGSALVTAGGAWTARGYILVDPDDAVMATRMRLHCVSKQPLNDGMLGPVVEAAANDLRRLVPGVRVSVHPVRDGQLLSIDVEVRADDAQRPYAGNLCVLSHAAATVARCLDGH